MADEEISITCAHCGQSKHTSEFSPQRGKPRKICKACNNAKAVAWRKNAAERRIVLFEGVRTCRICNVEKAVTAFPIHRQMIGGRAHECRSCTNERQRAWRKKAVATRPEFVAARLFSQVKNRAKRYGLTLEEFAVLEAMAVGKCEICQKPARARNKWKADSKLHVDHCHTTGKVRGMLCTDCNRGIGLFRDDPKALRRAADYLCR